MTSLRHSPNRAPASEQVRLAGTLPPRTRPVREAPGTQEYSIIACSRPPRWSARFARLVGSGCSMTLSVRLPLVTVAEDNRMNQLARRALWVVFVAVSHGCAGD